MNNKINGYIICSVREYDRIEHIHQLKRELPLIEIEEAIYPSYTKVPFITRLLDLSYVRTGYRLNEGELGCLLSHRRVWHKIVQRDAHADELFLVLESDSDIQNLAIIQDVYAKMEQRFDLFFWGAWEGHMKLFRSTRESIADGFSVGVPFIKTVYCTYGYALNKKAAAYLLQQTKKIAHPVDQFKYFIRDNSVRIGGVMPELISTNGKQKSYIRQQRNKVKEFLFYLLLDLKNSLICYFR
jgi:GR25 family glycosyltransferase involved in LPS biosynthesis